MASKQLFTIHQLHYVPAGYGQESPILVGCLLLDAFGEAVAFAKANLPISKEHLDASDRTIVNEILNDIQQAADVGVLPDLWRTSIRHFSLTLSLGKPLEVAAADLPEACDQAERLLDLREHEGPSAGDFGG